MFAPTCQIRPIMKAIPLILPVLFVLPACDRDRAEVDAPRAVEVVEEEVVVAEPAPATPKTPGQHLDHALQKTGEGIQTAGEKTEEGIRIAKEKTEAGLESAAEKTGKFLKRVGEEIGNRAKPAAEE
jgi:hypothetical protein